MTEFVSLKRHASKVYTRNIFMKVRKQIQRQGLYYKIDVVHSYKTVKYFLGKYDQLELKWTVELTKNSWLMECSCMKLEFKGLPFSHMFRYMVMEHMQSIPNTSGEISKTVSEMARYGHSPGPNYADVAGLEEGLDKEPCNLAMSLWAYND
ncbi:hypothetical protein M9H77_30685 [Catharanthus roseus]|uniref:Uncharacterized protein n=1 Tax=Catharanthus roseus TaxID=4058 RepID=A0ACC0A280_CATRO|nr:hypothetical protein M9H77_30685 [Catharanthus roseus]